MMNWFMRLHWSVMDNSVIRVITIDRIFLDYLVLMDFVNSW